MIGMNYNTEKLVFIVLTILIVPSLNQRKSIRYCIDHTPTSLVCDHEENDLVDGAATTINKGEFPHLAVVGMKNATSGENLWLCIGALVSNRFVLISAHCLLAPRTNRARIIVKLGAYTVNQTDEVQEFESERTFIHPEYKPPSKYNDIALIRLNGDVTFTKSLRPACFNMETNITDKKVILSSVKTDSNTDSFWKWTLNHVSIEECNRLYFNNNTADRLSKGISFETQQCWRFKQENCEQFMSGIIQVYHKKARCMYNIYGTGNFRHFCVKNDAYVYTNVQYYTPWIENIVWS